jgi:hypothetical protein
LMIQTSMFWLFFIQFLWQGQILSTSGAALRNSSIEHHDIQLCSFNQNQISMKFAEKSICHNNKNWR